MFQTKSIRIFITALLVILSFTGMAWATDGMYLSAYGPEAAGRGGANLGISDRSLGLNSNPAGITQLRGRHYGLGLSFLAPSLEFENMVNPSTSGESHLFPLPAFSYVRNNPETDWAWGLGFVAQGGMGADFRDLNTFFFTQDEIFSEVRYGTLIPTVAYAVNEDMSFGAALNIGWGDVAFKFFPNTSFFNAQMPEMSFFGMDMEDPAGGLQTSLRLGWWWRPATDWTVGVVYQTQTESEFDGATLIMNFENHPFLGQRVSYDAEVDGFTFAAQTGIGFSYRATDKMILAFDLKRIFWDSAIDTIEVNISDPSVQGAPPAMTIPFVFNWEDQWVIALGFDYRASDRLTLRGGYHYAENPVPDDTLNPLFPATVEQSFTAGVGYLVGNKTLNFGLEYVPEVENTNNNSNPFVNPFGPGSTVRHEQVTVSFGVTWALARK